jgi:hypothetical protein
MDIVMADINQLIAMGGRNVASPAERYMQTRKDMNAERRGAISEQQAIQGMDINRQKQQMLQQEQATKNMASLAQYLDTIPEGEQREAAFQAAVPKFQSQGLPPAPQGATYESVKPKLEQAKLQVHGAPKGEAVNVMHQGKLINAIETASGNYIDEQTRQPLYGATKAPSKQVVGTPSEFAFTGAGENKLEVESAKKEENVYKLAGGLSELKNFIKSPNYIGETTGDIISTGNSLVAQLRQVTGNEGKLTDEDVANKEGEYSRLRKAAQNNDQIASLSIDLGYMIAKMNDPGGRVTDADFKFARNIIAGSADRESTIKKIDNYMARQIKNYDMSETLVSERLKRQKRPFSQEKFRSMYGVEAKPDAPATGIEKLKTDIYSDFGL